MQAAPVSVVIITKNEEKNIVDCLESVSEWAGEIIVVDDESTDKTVELAKQYTDKVFVRRMDVEGSHRNWAYGQATQSWVLSLDADERVSLELRDEILEVLKAPEHDLYTIPRKNFIGEYWLQYGGQYPSAQLRLFRNGVFKYEEVEVHPRAFAEGSNGHLKGNIIHYSYRDSAHFLKKLNGQTTLEATKWVKTGREMKFGKALWRSIDRFFRAYIKKKGYKDGFYGFINAYFASVYQIMSYVKYWEMKHSRN